MACSAGGTPNSKRLSVRVSFAEDLLGFVGGCDGAGGRRGARRIWVRNMCCSKRVSLPSVGLLEDWKRSTYILVII